MRQSMQNTTLAHDSYALIVISQQDVARMIQFSMAKSAPCVKNVISTTRRISHAQSKGNQMNTHDTENDEQDARIRAALRQADKAGKLGVVLAVTGITYNEHELRQFINSQEALPPMVRAMLATHLRATNRTNLTK